MKIFIHVQRQFEFFLRKDKKNTLIEYSLNRKASVKDIVESLGIPHTEIGKLYFNDHEIEFSYIPCSSGILDVHAICQPFNVRMPSLLRPLPVSRITFIADVNVIKLGRLLLLLGFDVIYSSSYCDQQIADLAQSQNRIVLTRDTALLKRNKIVFAKRIRAQQPYSQLVEVIRFFGLTHLISFFSRCTDCNSQLEKVDKKKIMHLLEPKTKKYYTLFFQCPVCRKVFWRGSHYDNIQKKMASLGISINH